MTIADLTMTELVLRNSGPKPQAHCRIYMRADADIRMMPVKHEKATPEQIKRIAGWMGYGK